MIKGKKTYIRLMEEKDIPYKVKWVNDEAIRRTQNLDFPISEIGTKKWLQKVTSDSTRRDFIVCSESDNVPIGYCGLVSINFKHSKAESYLGLGDKDYWGKGHASEARRLILDYAFDVLDLNKVYSYVWAENEKMKHINKNVGFKIEGLLRDDIFYQGEYRDNVLMGLLKDEYTR